MATSSYVGIDVSKDRLDVAVLGEERGWSLDNTQAGIAKLVQQMQEWHPIPAFAETRQGKESGSHCLHAQVPHHLECDAARPTAFPHVIISLSHLKKQQLP